MAKSECGCPNPYKAADYRKLKEAQRQLSDLLPLMDKVEKCGVECDAFREVASELQSRFAAIEREFMSPPPQR